MCRDDKLIGEYGQYIYSAIYKSLLKEQEIPDGIILEEDMIDIDFVSRFMIEYDTFPSDRIYCTLEACVKILELKFPAKVLNEQKRINKIIKFSDCSISFRHSKIIYPKWEDFIELSDRILNLRYASWENILSKDMFLLICFGNPNGNWQLKGACEPKCEGCMLHALIALINKLDNKKIMASMNVLGVVPIVRNPYAPIRVRIQAGEFQPVTYDIATKFNDLDL